MTDKQKAVIIRVRVERDGLQRELDDIKKDCGNPINYNKLDYIYGATSHDIDKCKSDLNLYNDILEAFDE